MRLKKLYIDRFKNLREFTVLFGKQELTTVLVGRNGTGKSNLLEALTIIFRDLDLGQAPSFSYKIEYTIRGQDVVIEADPKRSRRKVIIRSDGEHAMSASFNAKKHKDLLPEFVFGYYSGPSNRLEEHFVKHQERFYRDLIAGKDKPLRPLFYARNVHSQFVLLSFFIRLDDVTKMFLHEQLRIEEFDSALFVMRQPPWKSKQGDKRFWRARGSVQILLDRLYEASLAPMRRRIRVETGFRRKNSLEHLYLYLPDLKSLKKIAEQYDWNQQEFFKALESTYISELISEVRIKVIARNVDGSLTFRELSEGEQQLLMVLGLLRFTREDEALFLLDEPDTHLNPVWSLHYMDYLKDVVGPLSNSHVIMATHDPLVIAGLGKSQVRILQMDEEGGRISAKIPDQDPKGMGIAGLLESEVYGLRAALDLETLAMLDEKRALASRDSLDEQEKSKLAELTAALGALDFSKSARDPLYGLFVKAMAERVAESGLDKPILSREEFDERKRLAKEVLAELKRNEPDNHASR